MTLLQLKVSLVALVLSVPLAAGIALAEPLPSAERPGATTLSHPGDAMRGHTESARPRLSVESSQPVTPFPMNLPDEATATETGGQYGTGLALLIIPVVLLAVAAGGLLHLVAFRSWLHAR